MVARAEDLEPIGTASIDVVTVRSVLIYVDNKEAAFRAFHRVLRPGGRVPIFEPINNYFADDTPEFWVFDASPVRDLVDKIWASERWDDDFNENDPMMNFTEKDLLGMLSTPGSMRSTSSRAAGSPTGTR